MFGSLEQPKLNNYENDESSLSSLTNAVWMSTEYFFICSYSVFTQALGNANQNYSLVVLQIPVLVGSNSLAANNLIG